MNPSDAEDMDALFDLWKRERLEYDLFCNDGILLPEVWKLEKPKLAFILKESNDDFCNIRGQAWDPKKGNSPRFWRQINIWAFASKQFTIGEPMSFDQACAVKEVPVGHIAYINLKKRCECKPRSDHNDIQSYVDR